MKNIVIIGSGFAGLKCALRLEKLMKQSPNGLHEEWSIILIDKNSYHTYAPALYEVASAYNLRHIEERKFEEILGSSLSIPIRGIVKEKDIDFMNIEFSDIDFSTETIKTKEGDVLPFDYLVLALGSEVVYFDVTGAEKCCYSLKTLKDAIKIRKRLISIFKEAQTVGGGVKQVKIVVAGAGFTGVEVAAEIATYAKHLSGYYKVNPSDIHIILMEAGGKILAQAESSQREAVEKRLKQLGVEILLNTKITSAMPGCIILEGDEKCEADIVIWGGGVKGPSVLQNLDIKLGERGRIATDKFLRAEGRRRVFAIGDNALFIDSESGRPAPATAFVAEQQADMAARNILSDIRGDSPEPYKLSIPGYITSCGGKYAVVNLFGFTFSGFFGWMMKKMVDFKYFLSILPIKKALFLWLRELRLFTRND